VRDPQERLLDMLEAIYRVEKYASQGREAFDADELIQVYVLHYLQILGEAAYKVPPEFRKKHPDIPWNLIQGMRHILVHDYFQVDLEVVWGVVEKDLPDLKQKLQDISLPGAHETRAIYKTGRPKKTKPRKKK
jgi:uncharacterized protein with HEPN domain